MNDPDVADIYDRERREDERTDDLIAARRAREMHTCDHPLSRHSWAGPCLVIAPEIRLRSDGSEETLRVYCPCRGVEG